MAKDSTERKLVLALLDVTDEVEFVENFELILKTDSLLVHLTTAETLTAAKKAQAIEQKLAVLAKEEARNEIKTAVLEAFLELQGKKEK